MTPSFPHCLCSFPVHQACAILLQGGEEVGVIPKCSVSLMQLMPHSLQGAAQVSSPSFVGRDVSFLGSGLRGGCQWADSWDNMNSPGWTDGETEAGEKPQDPLKVQMWAIPAHTNP